MKIVFLALAGGSAGHDMHQEAQMETWADGEYQNCTVLWMRGDPNIESPRLEGRNLILPVEESFENLLRKTILGVRWVLENLEFDYLVRTNTSNYFHLPLVESSLAKHLTSNPICIGVRARWKGKICGKKWFHSYISGAGIIINKRAAELLANFPESEYLRIPDDVAIGHYLKANHTKFKKIRRSNVTDFKPLWLAPQVRVKSWQNEIVTTQRMHEIDRIYTSRTEAELKFNYFNFFHEEILRAKKEMPRKVTILKLQYLILGRLTLINYWRR